MKLNALKESSYRMVDFISNTSIIMLIGNCLKLPLKTEVLRVKKIHSTMLFHRKTIFHTKSYINWKIYQHCQNSYSTAETTPASETCPISEEVWDWWACRGASKMFSKRKKKCCRKEQRMVINQKGKSILLKLSGGCTHI